MELSEVKKQLIAMQDLKNAEFSQKLSPDTKKKILGIRIPLLRNYAKDIVKMEDWQSFLNEAFMKKQKEEYMEEVMVQGFVLGYSPLPIEEKIAYIEKLIPKIDGWQICDTFIPTLKIKKKELNQVWNFILPYAKSKKEFEIRFAVIMMLDYFIVDEYVDEVIQIIDGIQTDKYYAQMGMAWCLAEIGIKFHEKAMTYLKGKNHLDNVTYNKALQKMIESYRVSEKEKNTLRKMKKTGCIC